MNTRTILTPCRVPWAISPSMSGVSLSHRESDVEPECSVTFGAGRLQEDGRTDSRRVEVTFKLCYYARVGPHSDTKRVEALGYTVVPSIECSGDSYLDWRVRHWRTAGCCPDSGFYVARESEWLESLPVFFQKGGFQHYLIDGRDSYVELVARHFKWQEWIWRDGERELSPTQGPVVDEGEGVA